MSRTWIELQGERWRLHGALSRPLKMMCMHMWPLSYTRYTETAESRVTVLSVASCPRSCRSRREASTPALCAALRLSPVSATVQCALCLAVVGGGGSGRGVARRHGHAHSSFPPSRVPGASLESARRVMSHVHMYMCMHVGPVSSDHRVALTLFSPSHVDVALHSRHVIQTDPRLSPPVATTSHTHRCVLMHDRRRVQAALATCRHAAHERGRASRLNSCPRAATLHRPCAGCSAHNSHPLPPASSPCPPSPRSQAVAHLLDAGDNVVDLREGVDLQVGGVRHRDVCAGDPLDGRVEVVERLRLVDARAYT